VEEKRNKMWAYILTASMILISILYYIADVYYMYLIVYIWFGFAYGLMLQYGRFCFASASRDLFAAGVPRMAVGIMIALIFFSLIQAILAATRYSTFHPAPFGIHMLISGSVFGVGMVLAGGCASGSLYKVGEGNGTSLLAVIFGLCLGQAIFVDVGGPLLKLVPQSWFDAAHKTQAAIKAGSGIEIPLTSWFDHYLVGYVWGQPQYTIAKLISGGRPETIHYFIGNAFINAIIPALLILCIIYYFFSRKVFMKKKRKELKKKGLPEKTGFGDELSGIWAMITASKRTSIMGVLIGITAGLHILTIAGMQKKFGVYNFGGLLTRMGHYSDVSLKGTVFDPGYWYITSQEGQVGAWILEKLGWNMHDNMFFGYVNGLPELWRNPALWMSLGIIVGAMVMARLSNEFKWKWPSPELIVWGFSGGLLMGFGSRPSLGCNIGGFFIRASGGDPNGWVYGTGMVLGAYIGVKFFNWYTDRKMAKEMAAM
jgi:uncharacterized membrane protein YedE/YeeE